MENKFAVCLLLLLMATQSMGGPAAFVICVAGCKAGWASCVAAAGGLSGGTLIAVAILACNSIHQGCLASCVAAGAAPTP